MDRMYLAQNNRLGPLNEAEQANIYPRNMKERHRVENRIANLIMRPNKFGRLFEKTQIIIIGDLNALRQTCRARSVKLQHIIIALISEFRVGLNLAISPRREICPITMAALNRDNSFKRWAFRQNTLNDIIIII